LFHEGVVVAEGREPSNVVRQGQHSKSPADYVRRTLAKVGGKVRGIGRVAAIADCEDLTVVLSRLTHGLDKPGDAVHRDGVERSMLRGQVVLNPLLHDHKSLKQVGFLCIFGSVLVSRSLWVQERLFTRNFR
jgi:hypothetical protein